MLQFLHLQHRTGTPRTWSESPGTRWGIFSLEEEVGDEKAEETQRGDDLDGDSLL